MHEAPNEDSGVSKYRPVIRSVGVGKPRVCLCETSNRGRSECGLPGSAVPTSREGLGHEREVKTVCVCEGTLEDGTEEEQVFWSHGWVGTQG